MGDHYEIEFIKDTRVDGLLLMQEGTGRYFFVDLVNAVIWACTYASKKEFEDHWTNAPGVKSVRKV